MRVPGFRPSFSIQVNTGSFFNLLRDDSGIDLDLGRQEWQVVDVPLDLLLGAGVDLTSVRFLGNVSGTFFLDDIRIVAAKLSPPATAVVESQDATVPESFTLSQNYPNPFNPATTIRFDLSRSEEIELAVYNLTGQKVATLAYGLREAGVYTVRWDGRDDDRRELASGVYLYRLEAGEGVVETRRMLLLK